MTLADDLFRLPEEAASPLPSTAIDREWGSGERNEYECECMGQLWCLSWALPGHLLNIPNTKGEAPSLGHVPGWPRSSPDIVTAQQFGVEVEDSGAFLLWGPRRGVWLPAWASAELLLSCPAFRTSG